MKKIPISIAIPALNEEANIKKLLTCLLTQKNKNYKLIELIVVSDGSTDNTVGIVNNFNNKFVRIVNYKKRKGKSARLNDIFHKVIDWNKSDLVVLFDADTMPNDSLVVDNLVDNFNKYENVRLVSGGPIPALPKTFFEKVLQVSAFLQGKIKQEIPNSVFTCHGRSLAIHKDLARKLIVPINMVGNDAFIYFLNKKNNYEYRYVYNANVKYRMPASFLDFKKQFTRFKNSQQMLQKYFGNWIVDEYNIPKLIYIKSILYSLFQYPISAPIYYISCIYALIDSEKNNKSGDEAHSGKWDVSSSTKKL